MGPIRKFSLTYSPLEDRIAWDGEDAAGVTVRLWLTQRLCRALVGAILPLFEGKGPGAAAAQKRAALQSFEQAAAIADFGKVSGVATTPETAEGLVKGVHIRPRPDRLDLVFDFGAGEQRILEAHPPAVRQTLFVLRRLYQVAGWPTEIWPDWVGDPAAAPSEGAVN